ncbi:MAG: ribosome assembly cofactor RimP [Bacteroidales bacterium]|nr:ribosome assembly cofactor RimP [Bacteroidales bacterium]
MIDRQLLTTTIEELLSSTDAFLVDLKVTTDNVITVEIDSPTGIDLDDCVELTRKIEERFDRDKEDYELEVGSAGLTSPLRVRGQYEKYLGQEIDVLTRDGRKLHGRLAELSPAEGPEIEGFTMMVTKKVKEEGKKKPVMVEEAVELPISLTKQVTYHLNFK